MNVLVEGRVVEREDMAVVSHQSIQIQSPVYFLLLLQVVLLTIQLEHSHFHLFYVLYPDCHSYLIFDFEALLHILNL